MKTMLPLLATLIIALSASAQNLVPNPSFELYTQCPSDLAQIDRAIGWESIQVSPDLFNTCCIGDTVGVPESFLGFQPAYDGSGYMGLGTGTLYTKEYAQAELSSALVPGQATYISMEVSPGGFGLVGTTSPQLAASGIGIRFSVQPLPYSTTYGQYDFDTAVVYLPTVLSDTSAWTNVSCVYIPDSAYRYIQIGNFFSDSLTTTVVINPNGDWEGSYAFVDQICVSQMQGVCEVIDHIQETNSAKDEPFVAAAYGILTVAGPAGSILAFECQVFDAVGRACTSTLRVPSGGSSVVNAQQWATGLYSLLYRTSSGRIGSVRFVHVHP